MIDDITWGIIQDRISQEIAEGDLDKMIDILKEFGIIYPDYEAEYERRNPHKYNGNGFIDITL